MRFAFVLDQNGERIESFDNAAQLKTVHQIDRHGDALALYLRKVRVLQAAGHETRFKPTPDFPLPALRHRALGPKSSAARYEAMSFAVLHNGASCGSTARGIHPSCSSRLNMQVLADN